MYATFVFPLLPIPPVVDFSSITILLVSTLILAVSVPIAIPLSPLARSAAVDVSAESAALASTGLFKELSGNKPTTMRNAITPANILFFILVFINFLLIRFFGDMQCFKYVKTLPHLHIGIFYYFDLHLSTRFVQIVNVFSLFIFHFMGIAHYLVLFFFHNTKETPPLNRRGFSLCLIRDYFLFFFLPTTSAITTTHTAAAIRIT